MLDDEFKEAKDPHKFLYGPFVGVTVTQKEVVRLTSFDTPQGGMTVYAPDQYFKLANAIEDVLDPQIDLRRKAARLKPD